MKMHPVSAYFFAVESIAKGVPNYFFLENGVGRVVLGSSHRMAAGILVEELERPEEQNS